MLMTFNLQGTTLVKGEGMQPFKPDTLWLLSDGKFSAEIPGAIRAANATVKARIHTVDLYDTSAEQSMRQISDENGGTFRFVPKPGSPLNSPAAKPPALPK